MKDKTKEELEKVEKRLAELRIQWSKGSPAMKKFIEAGAQVYTKKRDTLLKKLDALEEIDSS